MSTYKGNLLNNTINGDNATPFRILNTFSPNDLMNGLGGSDTINGLNGNDTIYGDAGGLPFSLINGIAGNDTIHGNSGNDTLYGEDGNDTLYGDSGIDTLEGGKGTNHLTGGAGGGSGIAGAPGDIYNLTTGKTNPDTIHIEKGDSPFDLVGILGPLGPKAPTGFDRIFNFDTYDKLDLPSAKIMKDTDGNGSAHGNGNGIIEGKGGDFGPFDKYSVTHGVIKLYDTHNKYVPIDTVSKAGDAYRYLKDNCLPENLDRVGVLLVNIKANLPGQPAGPHTVVFEDHTGPAITAIDIVGNVTGFITDDHHYS